MKILINESQFDNYIFNLLDKLYVIPSKKSPTTFLTNDKDYAFEIVPEKKLLKYTSSIEDNLNAFFGKIWSEEILLKWFNKTFNMNLDKIESFDKVSNEYYGVLPVQHPDFDADYLLNFLNSSKKDKFNSEIIRRREILQQKNREVEKKLKEVRPLVIQFLETIDFKGRVCGYRVDEHVHRIFVGLNKKKYKFDNEMMSKLKKYISNRIRKEFGEEIEFGVVFFNC